MPNIKLDEPFITYPDAKNAVLHFLLQGDKPIILYGDGGNGKTHLINEINDSIQVKEVLPTGDIKEEHLIELNNGGEIISTNTLDYLKELKEESYYLINMNKMHWIYDNNTNKVEFSCN